MDFPEAKVLMVKKVEVDGKYVKDLVIIGGQEYETILDPDYSENFISVSLVQELRRNATRLQK